ncbi:MAG: sigma-70 family RNA polymerase sigma factor [Lachnospiraceae bacterium]|nr:sigma-70 family RNA polymerase sigma factor [Lachnospiraceae bacterium]
MKEEIAELKYKLVHLGQDDSLIGNDVIMDYRSGYPVPKSVVGYDFEKERRLKARYREKIAQLEKLCQEVEEFIENIPDSMTRRIFRLYYLDGKKQKEIAKLVHMDRSTVSRKMDALTQ